MSQRLQEHMSHGAVKAELQHWTPLVLLAKQLVLSAGIKDFFFPLLTRGLVCLQSLEFNSLVQASRANDNVTTEKIENRYEFLIETHPKRMPGKSDAVTLCCYMFARSTHSFCY